MPRFTKLTVIRAANLLAEHYTHTQFDNLMLQFDVQDISGRSLQAKANCLIRFANSNPDHQTSDGRSLTDAIVEEAVTTGYRAKEDERFNRALHRDGYVIAERDGRYALEAMMPSFANVANANDEVHEILGALNMHTAIGHLDQGIDNHAAGK